jgi:hypothetical protein
MEAGTISVQRTLQRYGGVYHLEEPKCLRSRRTLILPSALVENLWSHRRRQLE